MALFDLTFRTRSRPVARVDETAESSNPERGAILTDLQEFVLKAATALTTNKRPDFGCEQDLAAHAYRLLRHDLARLFCGPAQLAEGRARPNATRPHGTKGITGTAKRPFRSDRQGYFF